MITTLGALGVGLVWGWLAATVVAATPRPGRDGLIVGGATTVAAVGLLWWLGWPLAATFAGGALAAAVAPQAWRDALRRQGRPADGRG